MSDKESFLRRWARRKSEASVETSDPAKVTDAAGVAPAENASETQAEAAFDIASLPPIESIGETSDVRAFLAAGVPAELTRAALRRAWSSDPSIRDFVGLSENAWDFNAPDGVPGFGSLTADEVRRLLRQLTGEPESAEAKDEVAATEATEANDQALDSGVNEAEGDQHVAKRSGDSSDKGKAPA